VSEKVKPELVLAVESFSTLAAT